MSPMDGLLTALHALACVYVIWRGIKLLSRYRDNRTVIFFLFAVACILMSDLYWIAYDLLQPEARMPFAANEICEGASFLLLAACLTTVFFGRFGEVEKVEIGTAAFAAANIILWIVWSGEWVQDILIGIAFGFLLCRTAACLKLCGALQRREWIILASLSGLLILLEVTALFVPESASPLLDTLCSVLLLAGFAFFAAKTLRAIRSGGQEEQALTFSAAAFAWCLVTMYSTEGRWYLAALLCAVGMMLLMLLAVEKEVDKL